jgi:hypothetical protein
VEQYKMKTSDVVMYTAYGVGGYLLYKFLTQLKKQTQNLLEPLSTAIASFWNVLTISPPLKVLGNVVLPDGTNIGPLSSFTVGMDGQNNVYIQALGSVYQVGQSDANGNWPVQLVLAPNFGVTGTTF